MQINETKFVTEKIATPVPVFYGEILKRRRKERGITLNELSERTRIKRSDLEDVEQGLLDLSVMKKQRIRKFLRRQKII